jgi:hypothetical protein
VRRLVWTTPEFVFFSRPSEEHWTKGKKSGKPAVLQLTLAPDELERVAPAGDGDDESAPTWMPVRFDAGTAKDDPGLAEREIITYCGSWQVRWSVTAALRAWEALDSETDADRGAAPNALNGKATEVGGAVFRHVTVKDDLDVVALEGEIVKSLRF